MRGMPMEREKDKEWEQPRHRKRNTPQAVHHQQQHYQHGGESTTFYVANLPNLPGDCTLGTLWKEFRLCDVRNNDAMVKALTNVRLGQDKIHANVARFRKEDSREHHVSKRGNTNRPDHVDRSRGRESNVEVRRTVEHTRTNPWKMTNHFQPAANVSRLDGNSFCKTIVIPNKTFPIQSALGRCSLVGNVKDVIRLCRMDEFLQSDEVKDVTVKYIAGMKVLLTFFTNGLADEFLSKEDLWGGWFSEMLRWNGQQIAFERVVWLKISGVPIQLWDKEVFNLIGTGFGSVVQQSAACLKDGNLAFETVAVLMKETGRISESVKLLWDGQSIMVRVDEIEETWCPDFLKASPDPNRELELNLDNGEFTVVAKPPDGSEPMDHELEDGEIRVNDNGSGGRRVR
ncbi:RNA-directed DNA polymerase, eukaryota [Artemisia annua]|uniref:RNA-directed DNA polymerase, eukaryota n=1 Tax=Artemisia annua TaxID=35608 RepID=A0A2U1KX80_ARTAN|nr:RNA-directed DNA polymerase, eukaryota [Artemisia annua]